MMRAIIMLATMGIVMSGSSVQAAPAGSADRVVKMKVDGESREFRVHYPPCYDGCTPTPVILVFHGMSANAKLIQKLTKLDDTADKFGFITVYPNGTGFGPLRGFKAGATNSRHEKNKPSDVCFVHAILNRLERTSCIDSSRVYATGLSNGAMLCYRLAVEMPHRIAAIAPVSGSLGKYVCRPNCPVSVLHFHGTCDEVLPYRGPSKGGLFPQSFYAVPTTIRMFADVANCQSEEIEALPNRCDDDTCVFLHKHSNCDCNVEVTLVEIRGGGHQWPQKPISLRYLGNATQEINANEMMCCFFLRHSVGQTTADSH